MMTVLKLSTPALAMVLFSTLASAADSIPVAFELEAPSSIRGSLVKKLAATLRDIEGIEIAANKNDSFAVVKINVLQVCCGAKPTAFSVSGSVTSHSDEKVMGVLLTSLSADTPKYRPVWSLMEYLMKSNALRTAEFHSVGSDDAFDEVMEEMRKGLNLLVQQRRQTLEKINNLKQTGGEAPPVRRPNLVRY
jgi:hypothetical protein